MFQVGDIVKKKTGVQKYKVVEVLENQKYMCINEPEFSPNVKFVFKGIDLELSN